MTATVTEIQQNKSNDTDYQALPELSLSTQSVTLGYDQTIIANNLSVDIPEGKFSIIVGPNGCGKSTLLRALSRLLPPTSGQVRLNGQDIHSLPTREVAKILGLLPQSAIAPDGIKVVDLVARGRFPHQKWFQPWREQDQIAVESAMKATGIMEFAQHHVDQLSGGQKQRVWVAMALAQETPLLLLDEPTTYLDIAHQIELMDLFQDLNRLQGHTMVAVLHDLNHACRYADNLIAMKAGKIIASGAPKDIVTEALIEDVFGLPCMILEDPVSGTPLIIPKGRQV
ncbi:MULTISPECIES: ABC transporter ATP-binding protein [Marinomonas]|jgi:ferric enterobactin transport system ATP-binding protein|uniref:Iron complex transport system ATP-binding protein n=1 Tax=Marinomonas polaris DSM 16579 TaxID=1122206 RepID=A0A1M4TJ39_9GAMM|nr:MULTISPECIES: ABC transporter ATP-binding protein [Marinomonas]MBU1295712.1 ABC transporter ATP-binding protein [Gammaproteobacteria bacterium]MBU1468204.1 ABC transporter ATP-binding protein [Gammaproteobacteria bacterium]MBU2022786.1 ABC transporter ATP-binding protein [Gammaproteobacteria bacterium]MBU2236451.1 ABC transporter ATP-binding protein [Gammaproteobacteria bacterium]MBU2317415.1 ABC transporter ATP-binding protein [Gammaproteobacteria bacterium]